MVTMQWESSCSAGSASARCSNGSGRGARGGHGGVLVVHGEPGVGKTALLEHAVEAAGSFGSSGPPVSRGRWSLPYAALQQLCAPMLELTERLPAAPARRACGRVRTRWRGGTEPVPGRAGGPRAVVRGRRGAAAPLRRRRRAVARWRVGALARIRRSPPVGGEDRARVRDARAGRRARTRFRSSMSSPWAIAMRGRCSSPSCRLRWTSACWTGSSRRRAAIRSH